MDRVVPWSELMALIVWCTGKEQMSSPMRATEVRTNDLTPEPVCSGM